MVPSAFVFVPALPRLRNGKIDRRALADWCEPMDLPRGGSGLPSGMPPRTPLEQFLAGLWRELLQVEPIGIEDNFFELGGSSIQAAMFINRLQQKLGQRINTVVPFDTPTIAGLVRYLNDAFPETIARLFSSDSAPGHSAPGEEKSGGRPGVVIPLQPHGSRPPCFMVHPPGGIVVSRHGESDG